MMRDIFLSSGVFETWQVRFNFSCVIYRLKFVTAAYIKSSFELIKTFLLRPSYALNFQFRYGDVTGVHKKDTCKSQSIQITS